MKKMYTKPENTVVALNVKVSLMEPSIPKGQGENAGEANSREVVFSQESINSRNAWEVWE